MKIGFNNRFIAFVRELYKQDSFIPLHEPRFLGNEKKYVSECLDSTFVSSVGKFVDEFEKRCAAYCGVRYGVAVVNGTAALHTALVLNGIGPGDGVITQPVSFVATSNAIAYTGAKSVFVDVDKDTLSLSPEKLEIFLKAQSIRRSGELYHQMSGLRLRACVVMHTFGHPARMIELKRVCEAFGLVLIEDAAEGLGSFLNNKHVGTFASLGVLSFNGNKIITTGGGGMLLTDNDELARQAKHLTTTAKIPHAWEYSHDAIGYNYRMPNLNAALGLAQIEQIGPFVAKKRKVSEAYSEFLLKEGVSFVQEPPGALSNYWLNALVLEDRKQRDEFLKETNAAKVMTRPLWNLLNETAPFKDCPKGDLENAIWLENRVVNIPSSVPR